MKKAMILATVVSLSCANAVVAEEQYSKARGAGVFTASAIVGAAVAGPAGMVVGALSGVWLDKKVVKAGQAELIEKDLAQASSTINALEERLTIAEQVQLKYAELAVDELQLELLFKTGATELSESAQEKLALLADFIAKNEQLDIQLDGYADPRGDAAFNLQLSEQRVAAVAKALVMAGIDPARISTHSYGDSQSIAAEGDYDAYALERVVRIELLPMAKDKEVAQLNLPL